MFYLQELLTERKKQGIAMIWLLAAFGSRSEIYRVKRKEVQSVNVPQACDSLVVMGQEVPFALRLQSSLLLGITRVYSLQAGYFFQEVTNASTAIKMHTQSLMAKKTLKVTSSVPKDALVMEDDPFFHPELAFTIPGFKFEMTPLPEEFSVMSLTPQSSQSPSKNLLSSTMARHRGSSIARSESIQLPAEYEAPPAPPRAEDEFMLDAPFEFNAEGEMIETQSIYSQGPFMSGASYSAFSGHSPAHQDLLGDDFQFHAPEVGEPVGDTAKYGQPSRIARPTIQNEQLQGLHWTAPLPGIMGNLSYYEFGAPDGCDCEIWDDGEDEEDGAGETPKRTTRPRSIFPALDENTELRNRDIRAWKSEYEENMKTDAARRENVKGKLSDKENRIQGLFNLGGRPLGGQLAVFAPLQLFENGAARRAAAAPPPLPPKPDTGVARGGPSGTMPPTPIGAGRAGSEIESNIARDEQLAGIVDISGLDQGAPWDARSESFGGFSIGSRGVSPAGSLKSLAQLQRNRAGSVTRRPVSRSSWRQKFGDETIGSHHDDVVDDFSAGDDTLGAFADDSLQLMQEQAMHEEPLGPIDADHDREAAVFHEYLRLQIAEKNPGNDNFDFDVLLPPDTSRGVLAANAFYLVLRLASKDLITPTQSVSYGKINLQLKDAQTIIKAPEADHNSDGEENYGGEAHAGDNDNDMSAEDEDMKDELMEE